MKTLNRFNKLLYAVMGAVLVTGLLSFSNTVYASDEVENPTLTMSSVTYTEVNKIKDCVDKINKEIVNEHESTGILEEDMITFSKEKDKTVKNDTMYIVNVGFRFGAYKGKSTSQKQAIMGIALENVENSDMSQMNRSKIYNFISSTDSSTSSLVRQLSDDVTADFASAYSSFKPFTGVIGWILGVLTLGIFIILGLVVVIDIAYIVLPIFLLFLSNEKEGKKARLVSTEAYNAVKEAENTAGGGYKEPLTLYFKSKTKQFLALGICLLYLVSGQIYSGIAYIIDMFGGIFG